MKIDESAKLLEQVINWICNSSIILRKVYGYACIIIHIILLMMRTLIWKEQVRNLNNKKGLKLTSTISIYIWFLKLTFRYKDDKSCCEIPKKIKCKFISLYRVKLVYKNIINTKKSRSYAKK